MMSLAANVVAATMLLTALSGCFSDETEIQGINVKFINEADRQVMVEVWTTTRPEGGPHGSDFVIRPGTHPWAGVFADCSSNGGSIYLQAYLKEPTRNYPDEHEILASKRWEGLQCHELYTVVIDQGLGMAMYHCDPCKGDEKEFPGS